MSIVRHATNSRRRRAAKRLAGLAAATAFIARMNAPAQALEVRVNVPVVTPKVKVPIVTPALNTKLNTKLPALNAPKGATKLNTKPNLSLSSQNKVGVAHDYKTLVRFVPPDHVEPHLQLPSPFLGLQNGADPAALVVIVMGMVAQDSQSDLSQKMQQMEGLTAAKQSLRLQMQQADKWGATTAGAAAGSKVPGTGAGAGSITVAGSITAGKSIVRIGQPYQIRLPLKP